MKIEPLAKGCRIVVWPDNEEKIIFTVLIGQTQIPTFEPGLKFYWIVLMFAVVVLLFVVLYVVSIIFHAEGFLFGRLVLIEKVEYNLLFFK